MEHNSLSGIASAHPIIFAEGLFAPCHLQDGKFVPKEGLNQNDLWSILNGDFFNSGSDLVEDFTLKTKLGKLQHSDSKSYELEDFTDKSDEPPYIATPCKIPEDLDSKEKDRKEIQRLGIPLVQLSPTLEDNQVNVYFVDGKEKNQEDKLRTFFEKEISWLMGEEGDEFVVMETCSQFHEALILLDVLKKNNVPSVLSFLARRNEPVAISFSKIKIELDSLMFCLFQA